MDKLQPVLKELFVAIAGFLLTSWVLQLLWNSLSAQLITPVLPISYVQAMQIKILCNILFKSVTKREAK
jgi:hypothetical protein